MMKKFISFGICMAMMAFAACDKDNDVSVNNEYEPIDVDLKTASLIKSSNSFGVDIFKEVLKEQDNESNVLVSPLSIFQALSMTRNGAKNTTLTEMNDVLAFDASILDNINQYQKKLIDALKKADKKLTLDVANSIWHRADFDVIPDFTKVNQDYFNAEVSAWDASDLSGAKTKINNWVKDNTKGKIPEIVDEVTPSHVMFLINAIYFYGEWKTTFDAKATKEEVFYTETGAEIKAKMMHQESAYRFAQNDIFSMVEMPYGNGHFNMVALLPNSDKKVSDIVEALNDEAWGNWINNLSEQNIKLAFPKFKFEGDYELKKSLVNIGMPTVFTPSADFTGINASGGIYISAVKHKTFIEVDEKGTEAAAVTSVEIELTSVDPEKSAFYANKPFVFAITEKDTNTILFLGKLMMTK